MKGGGWFLLSAPAAISSKWGREPIPLLLPLSQLSPTPMQAGRGSFKTFPAPGTAGETAVAGAGGLGNRVGRRHAF